LKKNKFIAAIVTTLIFFAIIRSCSPDKEAAVELDANAEQEEVWEPADQTFDPSPKSQKKVEVPKLSPADNQNTELAETPKKKVELDDKNLSGSVKADFSKKSDFVYFNIKDGLALVGGDVIIGELSEEQKDKDFKGRLLKQKPERSKLWPSHQIPVAFSVGFPEALKVEVQKAIKYMNAETVIEFVNAEEGLDQDLIIFQERAGSPCASYLGRTGGYQPIYMNSACKAQDVLHEMMHALGFVHEQQREDRDGSLKILWENIDEFFAFNFAILPDSMVHPYEGSVFRLDFNSIMMYPETAFADKGKKSMQSLTRDKITPISSGLSDIDKKRLEYLYGS
jgi:hypothetical protein